nr:MAG TPA: DNA-directed RNA polymerase [Caudoviricetes sp.]
MYYNGHGVFVVDITTDFYCPVCEETYNLEGETNDTRDTAYADCEVCGWEIDKELYND